MTRSSKNAVESRHAFDLDLARKVERVSDAPRFPGSAAKRAIGAVHGMRSQAQPKVATTQKKAEGEVIRWVEPRETRASHSRPVCRAVRVLY